MKSTILKSIVAVTIFAASAIPIQLAAEDKHQANAKQIHYSVINVGALGGPKALLTGVLTTKAG